MAQSTRGPTSKLALEDAAGCRRAAAATRGAAQIALLINVCVALLIGDAS